MGFLKDLGSSITGGIRDGVVNGTVKGIYDSLDRNSDGVAVDVPDALQTLAEVTYTASPDSLDSSESAENTKVKAKATKKVKRIPVESDRENWKMVNTDLTSDLHFSFPDWNYADYINERSSFQKHISSMFDDPGYFYFKVFFKFDTQHGLFGGLLNNTVSGTGRHVSSGVDGVTYDLNGSGRLTGITVTSGRKSHDTYGFTASTNSAAKYLYLSRRLYVQENIKSRLAALEKFTSILSYVSTNAPWFFKAVKGLTAAGRPYINDFMKDREVEIDVTPDAVDMRLSTMMSLYKYACYDDINCKEIIPENLRKFDMQVVLFGIPLRYFHTAFRNNTGSGPSDFRYKGMAPSDNDFSNVMSYKMFTFKNCEFDIETLGNMVPDSVTDDSPYQMGNASLKIKYDRVYEHTMNEFNGILFGSDGMYYNQYSMYQDYLTRNNTARTQAERLKALRQALSANVKGKTADTYKAVVDASEALISDNMRRVSPYAMGNIFGEYFQIGSPYWQVTVDALKDGHYTDVINLGAAATNEQDFSMEYVKNYINWNLNRLI